VAVKASWIEDSEVTSRASLRMLGVEGSTDRVAGLRAVATMREVVLVER